MRFLLVVLFVVLFSVTASATLLSDNWLRGASSVALNDDATAIFVNPAGLGMYNESGCYSSYTMVGEQFSDCRLALKGPGVGFGYSRSQMWEATAGKDGSVFLPGDDAFDTFVVGMALGEFRKLAIGFDYRWFRPHFGDALKTGTWDVGIMYRPADFLSLGGTVTNLSEPRIFGEIAAPITYTAGLAVRPIGNRLTLMADASVADKQDIEDTVYTGGLEAEIIDGVVLRGSVQSFTSGDEREQETSFGLWFNTTHFGGGASTRSHKGTSESIYTVEFGNSTQRLRTILKPGEQLAEIEISGPLNDYGSRWSLLGKPRGGVQRLIRDIRRAAEDSSVECVLLNIKPLGSGFMGGPSALVQELRDAIVSAGEKHGTRFVAFLEYGAGTPEYYLASAADVIVMPRIAGIDGLGQYVNIMRYTGTTEKLGVEWDYISAGKYKSTFHSIGAGPLTDVQREEVQSMIDDNFRETVTAMAGGRDMTYDEMEALADGRPYTPPDALTAGLIDVLGFYADAKATALELAGGDLPDEPEEISTVDVSGWTKKTYDWSYGPKVVIIGAYGGIGVGKSGNDPIWGRESIGSETLVKQLRRARNDDSIKAVVLRVDSGGGSALASDIIWAETKKLAEKKPFIVSMGDLAGSGGYYIACAAERIFADPLTITGSIGVVMMKASLAGLYGKIDATHETFKSSEFADAWSSTRRFTDDENEVANDYIQWMYEEFLDRIVDGRGIDKDELRKVAEGRVYTGNQALELKLIDELGGLTDAVAYACESIGTTPADATLVLYRTPKDIMDLIMEEVSIKLGLWRMLDIGGGSLTDMVQFRAVTGQFVD
jgi:protease-4